ncbi:MAG: FIST C-terminal domain-containing protein [Deltaproteobacteria bacterium]|nr:FIST C-terminal domain-containing protein [Deltaproteobacteria bacterium]
MTKAGIGYCNMEDAFPAGRIVAEKALKDGQIERPDVVIAFCGGSVDHERFFAGIQSIVGKGIPIIGGSAVGVITNHDISYKDSPAGAAILQMNEIKFRIAAVEAINNGEQRAGRELIKKLGCTPEDRVYLIFYDSVRSPATEISPPVLNTSSGLLAGIEKDMPCHVPIIGAGLVKDYAFGPTMQFCGSYVGSQRVIGLVMSGAFFPYYRIMHGCTPLDGVYHRITGMDGSEIYNLDGRPIVEVIDEIFGDTGWRKQHPVNSLTIGVNYGFRKHGRYREDDYVNRLITGILPGENGIGIFEADLEPGMEIQFMLRDTELMVESAKRNTSELLQEIHRDGRIAVFGIYIDCAGRTADYSHLAVEEAAEVQKVLNHHGVPLLGFYSGVEIAPLLGKGRGLDWTGVLLILTEDKQSA